MDNQKRMDILRQRNVELSQKLQDTQKRISELENLDVSKSNQVDGLIAELKQLQKDFIAVINDLQLARDRYLELNKQLVDLKKNFEFQRPWHQKIFSHK